MSCHLLSELRCAYVNYSFITIRLQLQQSIKKHVGLYLMLVISATPGSWTIHLHHYSSWVHGQWRLMVLSSKQEERETWSFVCLFLFLHPSKMGRWCHVTSPWLLKEDVSHKLFHIPLCTFVLFRVGDTRNTLHCTYYNSKFKIWCEITI
jgi:hypothetical protein